MIGELSYFGMVNNILMEFATKDEYHEYLDESKSEIDEDKDLEHSK